MRTQEHPFFGVEMDALASFVDALPYPVQLFRPDGLLVKVNPAFLREFQVADAADVEGRYNLLSDPTVAEHGMDEMVRRMFEGQTLFPRDIYIPLRELKERLNLPVVSQELTFADVTSFCVKDRAGRPQYFVNLYMPRRKYYERSEIVRAVSYIEQNWLEDFSIENMARAVNLSPSYCRKLFTEHTGFTPHEYYTNLKIDKLKEALMEADLTVEQAFLKCGISYHGYYARLFHEKTGYTPTQYRRLAKNKAIQTPDINA